MANETTPRSYRIHVPTTYDQDAPIMLVMDFHGYYQTEFDEERLSGLVAGSDDDNYIVIFPHGGGDSGEVQSWNAVGTTGQETKAFGKTCNTDRGTWGYYDCYNSCIKTVGCVQKTSCLCSSCYDDRYFVTHILDDVLRSLCIEESHVHATGYSNGGMMAYEVGTHLSTHFASIAPTASAPLLGFNVGPTQQQVSILDFHGTNDDIIPGNTSQVRVHFCFVCASLACLLIRISFFSSPRFIPGERVAVVPRQRRAARGDVLLGRLLLHVDGRRDESVGGDQQVQLDAQAEEVADGVRRRRRDELRGAVRKLVPRRRACRAVRRLVGAH